MAPTDRRKARSLTYADGTYLSTDPKERGTRMYWGRRKHWGRRPDGALTLLDGPDPVQVANLPLRERLAEEMPLTAAQIALAAADNAVEV